ncbi:MAG: ribonuclease HII [Candidatus Liptonbacteria bacterium]|nr:ribonuclease HII [Candidatus Liptonbacteria bacterium]
MSSRTSWVIGLDEVGRGPLAGPVVVAALARSEERGARSNKRRIFKGIKDSKKLSPKQREEWVRKIKAAGIPYAIASVSPAVIDRINISRAANLAALRAFRRLATRYSLLATRFRVYLDGGLYLGNSKKYKNRSRNIRAYSRHNSRFFASTIIRGDEKYPAVAAASIIAKVHRDRHMTRLARRYPRYGLEIHKGYGTAAHLAAIRRHGPSLIHRRSFLRSGAR